MTKTTKAANAEEKKLFVCKMTKAVTRAVKSMAEVSWKKVGHGKGG
jgi:hypothetical protein